MVTYRSILKLILPPIIINIFKNIKKNFIQKDKNVDSRRFWDGEIIHSDDFKFKRIFKDFNLKTFAVTTKRETRDSIIVDPGKSEILYLKEFNNNEELFFGIGNLSEKAIINGSVEFILENNQDVKLRNPSKTKWENFKIKIENKLEKIEIKNLTKEKIFISCPVFIKNNNNSEEIDNVIILMIDQVDNETFTNLEYNNAIPFTSSFFKNSINFKNYFSNSEWTAPSFYSFFNSKYSSSHGMFDFKFSKNIKDPTEGDNLLKYFKENNFFSLGISRSKGNHPGFQFQKYFDRLFYFPNYKGQIKEKDYEQKIIEHLEANSTGKNFVFVHYTSSHTPFDEPSINEDVNFPTKRIGDTYLDYKQSIVGEGTSKIEKIINPEKLDNINLRMQERLSSIDLSLSKLYGYIDKKIKDKTMVLITSDHGLNHIKSKEDGFLNKERINVPLRIFHPKFESKYSVNNFISSIDIYRLIKNLIDKSLDKQINSLKNFFESFNKSEEVISESIFDNIYKVSFRSEKIVFDYCCFFDAKEKIVFLNKWSKNKISNLTNSEIDESLIIEKYKNKIIEHIKRNQLLSIEN